MAHSISEIAYQAERAKIRAAREEARGEPLTDQAIVDSLRKQADAKVWWIDKHGSSGRWPKDDVDRKREELRVLVQAADRIKTFGGNNGPPAS